MYNKRIAQQLLITSEYLRLLLEEDKNYGFEIDGHVVTACSLRNDIEQVISEYYPILSLNNKEK